MPYVDKNSRQKYLDIDKAISRLDSIENKGDMEYILFRILVKFMSSREFKYSTLHEAVYGCQHVADEFRRRFLDIRENQALETNGDIKETIYLNDENED